MSRTETDFNFICGVLRSRERHLLDYATLDGLVGLDTYAEIVAQLPETRFASAVRRFGESSEAIDAGVLEEITEIRHLLSTYVTNEALARLVFLPWDMHNLKITVMSGLTGKSSEALRGPEGQLRIEELSEHQAESDYEYLPQDIYEALQAALVAYFQEDRDTQAFEFALDRQKDLLLLGVARGCSPEIMSYVVARTELKLAELVLRAKRAELSWALVRWGIRELENGLRLEEFYDLPLERWEDHLSVFERGPFRSLLAKCAAETDLTELVSLEKQEALKVFEAWKYYPPSVEYCYYYLSRKLAEVYSLRLILLGKLNRLPDQELSKRIPYVYL